MALGIGQLGKCLPSEHENPGLMPRWHTYTKARHGGVWLKSADMGRPPGAHWPDNLPYLVHSGPVTELAFFFFKGKQ